MLTVLTWLWRQPGGRVAFEAAHVNIWAAMVRRHLAMPHRLACVTEHPEGIDPSITIIPPPGLFEDIVLPRWPARRPQCLRRIAMFAPDAAARFGERFVCMDLDVVIAGPLDPLFQTGAAFKICAGTAPGRPYNGSLMLLTAGARPQVHARLTEAAALEASAKFVGSDQAWLAHVLGPHERTWGASDGVAWWHRGRIRPPADARLMFFPGEPKPWQVAEHAADGFVADHYRGAAAGPCLILGRGETVWADAEAALAAGPPAAVVAVAEAAAHWPGPVLAVARDIPHAARIARMHGYTETRLCGAGLKEAA